LADPHLIERGAFAKLSDGAGELLGVNAPWKMSGAQTSMRSEIPAIGAHRDEVLSRALGLSSGAIADLAEAGVFGKIRATSKA
jgi:crotonobetainyl-CoA:carnitine CoA-transferase CaiB-like acyl-CoA transferase